MQEKQKTSHDEKDFYHTNTPIPTNCRQFTYFYLQIKISKYFNIYLHLSLRIELWGVGSLVVHIGLSLTQTAELAGVRSPAVAFVSTLGTIGSLRV